MIRVLVCLILLSPAAVAESRSEAANRSFLAILETAFGERAPVFLRISDGPCWQAHVLTQDGIMLFGGGQGPEPHIAQDSVSPMLLLHGSSDQMGGPSYMVLRPYLEGWSEDSTIFRTVAICRGDGDTQSCTGAIGGLHRFSLEVSTQDFCNPDG